MTDIVERLRIIGEAMAWQKTNTAQAKSAAPHILEAAGEITKLRKERDELVVALEICTKLRTALDAAEKVEPTGFLRTLVQIHPDGTETWKEEPFYTRPTSPALAKLGADKTGEVEQDLNTCPSCGGPADNGFSREIPPSPYYCTKCMEKLK